MSHDSHLHEKKTQPPQKHPAQPGPQTDEVVYAAQEALTAESIRRSLRGSGALSPQMMLHLQRTIGNQAVQRCFVQRQAGEEEETIQARPLVQRRAQDGFDLDEATAGRIERARAGGQPLQRAVQEQMSAALGHDFGGVRVHADAEAHDLNRRISARAFTTGQDLFFRQGEYSPDTDSGRELIAHELTHVVQQSSGRLSRGGSGMTVRPAGDVFEREADTLARQAAHAGAVQRALLRESPPEPEEEEQIQAKRLAQRQSVIQRIVYPDFATVTGDRTVTARTDAAWDETKRAASAAGRREQGFWIRWNSSTSAFSITGETVGSTGTNPPGRAPTGAAVTLPAKPADSGDDYTVASFHTHTPTAFWASGWSRRVGPSPDDHSADRSDNVTGVVYDYESDTGSISSGHPLNSSARRYHSGPNRRT